MTPKLLLDENLRSRSLWNAIEREKAARGIDVVRAGDVDGSPGGATDIDVLAWAAVHERIIVSLDHDTLPNYFAAFLAAGNSSPGLIMLHGFLSILELSEILVLVCIANNSDEYRDRITWLP